MRFQLLIFIFLLIISQINAQSPGNIAPTFWVKAGAGVEEGSSDPAEPDDPVQFWLDQAGSHNCSQTILANRPIFKNNSSDNINYHPVITFTDIAGSTNDSYFTLSTPERGDFDFYILLSSNQTTSGNRFWNQPVFWGGDLNFGNMDLAFTINENNTLNIGGGQSGDFNIYGSTTINNQPRLIQISRTVNGVSDSDYAWRIDAGENGASNRTEPDNGRLLTSTLRLGKHDNGEPIGFHGKIAEIAVYNTAQSVSNRAKIESYFAIKYGISLSEDYVNTLGTTLYSAGSYTSGIVAIGREDSQALLQKQSHNINMDTHIYLSSLAVDNSSNVGSFSANNQFIIMGHNNEAIFANGSDEFPAGENIFSRIDREFKVTNTNFDGTFSIDLDMGSLTINTAHLRLLVDSDGDFSDAAIASTSFSYSGSTLTINNISTTQIPENSTRYFTIASIHSDTPLPVELKQFKATQMNNNKVKLSWQTASELNNAYFKVQRSSDKQNWSVLKELNGAGNSSKPTYYSYVDHAPLQRESYYRLMQVDFNGSHSFSSILAVEKNTISSPFSAYPNPVHNQTFVRGNKKELENIKVFNILGQDVTNRVFLFPNGSRVELDLSRLPNGLYAIKSGKKSIKIYKH